MIRIIAIIGLFMITGCSQSLYMQGRAQVESGQYTDAVDKFYAELKANPDNYKAWRELGVAFYKKGDWIKAEDALKQANNIQQDARTNLYIGLIFEKKNQYDRAITAYAAALNLKGAGKTKNMIRAHLDNLIGRKFKSETAQVIKNEAQINADTIPENTIAVIDFDGSSLPPELEPISYGLAEFTSVDLSKISGLKVVDRLKIDLLIDELKLSKSKYADRTTAPRIGRLLGSQIIITGTLLSTGENSLRLDGALVNTIDSTTKLTGPTEGDLQKFFKLQKNFVFKIIDTLGITISKEERDAIAEVPTESFVAFMSYCRGLKYQSLGMHQAAKDAYNQASSEDNNFNQAENNAENMDAVLNAKLAPGGELSAEASVEQFETGVTDQMDSEEFSTDLGQMQNSILNNSGFIYDRQGFDRFGHTPLLPPQQTDIIVPTATIFIRGNLDAD